MICDLIKLVVFFRLATFRMTLLATLMVILAADVVVYNSISVSAACIVFKEKFRLRSKFSGEISPSH